MLESFDQNAPTPEERAILLAFEQMDLTDLAAGRETQGRQALAAQVSEETQQSSQFDPVSTDDLLIIFVNEVDEDITALQQTLRQLEMGAPFDAASRTAIRRIAHKVKGTTAAMGCLAMARIASTIEELTEMITTGELLPLPGTAALARAVDALQNTLEELVMSGQESSSSCVQLEEELKPLNLHLLPGLVGAKKPEDRAPPSLRVDSRRFDRLMLRSEQLAELHAQLENAQGQMDTALQELHTAQTHLSGLETAFSAYLAAHEVGGMYRLATTDKRLKSSLIARILSEAPQRSRPRSLSPNQRARQVPSAHGNAGGAVVWDELEMDRFSEGDVLAHQLSEAIADVMIASSQLRVAFTHLRRILHTYMDQSTSVRNDALLLRETPLSALLPDIEHIVAAYNSAEGGQLQFDVHGETTEIDQNMLESLRDALCNFIGACLERNSMAWELQAGGELPGVGSVQRLWLYAREDGNAVTLEIGFSVPVDVGEARDIQELATRLRGLMVAEGNSMGGTSILLRLPRAQAGMQGLLARVGNARVIAPFSQVQRIDDGGRGNGHQRSLYALGRLLGLPLEPVRKGTTQPLLLLEIDGRQVAVQVEEIVGDINVVVKPLARHLQRPGIAGTAIDGTNNVVLALDLHELIRHYELRQTGAADRETGIEQDTSRALQAIERRSVLIADDSVFIRQSLLQLLRHAGYDALEAHDGIEALEQLLERPPDALLLDIEMPNLNGYDLLSLMRTYPALAGVKVIMLTSRSLDKHQQSARDLGAHAYLTKPCAPETLLETLKNCLET